MENNFGTFGLLDRQSRINTARVLFKTAMASVCSTYSLFGVDNTARTGPRMGLYSMLNERRMNADLDGYATVTGFADAIEWISTNGHARSFFTALASTFYSMWYENDNYVSELCEQIGVAFSIRQTSDAGVIKQEFPIPDEIISRALELQEIRDQCKVNKWLMIYSLFLLWGSVDEIQANDEPFQLSIAQRVHST